MEKLIRIKFHSINRQFTIINKLHEEKLDKSKFQKLLAKNGLALNDADIDLLWKDFDCDQVSFSNVIRRFLKSEEFDQIRNIKYKVQIGLLVYF